MSLEFKHPTGTIPKARSPSFYSNFKVQLGSLGGEKVKVMDAHDLEIRFVTPTESSENKVVRINIRHLSGRRRLVRGLRVAGLSLTARFLPLSGLCRPWLCCLNSPSPRDQPELGASCRLMSPPL